MLIIEVATSYKICVFVLQQKNMAYKKQNHLAICKKILSSIHMLVYHFIE